MIIISRIKSEGICLAIFGVGEELHIGNAEHIDLSKYLAKRGYNRYSGKEHLTFSKKIYLLLQNYDSKQNFCTAILFAREPRANLNPHIEKAEPDKYLQLAMRNAVLKPIRSVPFKYVILFKKEIAVGNFEKEGNSGWIITPEELNSYLKVLPPIKSSGIIAKMWILYYAEEIKYVWEEIPTRPEGVNTIIEVQYDSGSLVVRNLIVSETQLSTKSAMILLSPPRYVNISRRLPPRLRKNIKN